MFLTVSSTLKEPLTFSQDYELDNVLNINLEKHTVRRIFDGHDQLVDAVLGQYGIREVKGRLFGYFGAITLEHSRDGGFSLVHT